MGKGGKIIMNLFLSRRWNSWGFVLQDEINHHHSWMHLFWWLAHLLLRAPGRLYSVFPLFCSFYSPALIAAVIFCLPCAPFILNGLGKFLTFQFRKMSPAFLQEKQHTSNEFWYKHKLNPSKNAFFWIQHDNCMHALVMHRRGMIRGTWKLGQIIHVLSTQHSESKKKINKVKL